VTAVTAVTGARGLIFIILAGCGDQTVADNPRLDVTDIGFALTLPARMQQALDSVAPGMRLIRAADFRSDVREAAAEEGGGAAQALFAVVADFDGDGSQDVAVEGISPSDTALVVVAILNTGTRPTALVIGRFPAVDGSAVGIYLSRPAPPKPGAFEVVNYPDASTLYFYRGGTFEGMQTGG
jgi:hypothetical protein